MKVALLIPDNRDEFKDWSDPNPRFGPAPAALLEGFAEIPDCEIHVVCCVHRPVQSPEKLAPNIWYHSLVVPRMGWRLAYAGCVWKLRRKLRELQPDVVHGQGTERYCALAAAFSGFPNLVTVHGNMRAVGRALGAKVFSMLWLTAKLETISLRQTKGVICLTNYTKAQVGDLARRTWIIPNAVDSSFFQVKRDPEPTPTILCAADAAVYKNQIRLIEALEEVVRTTPVNLLLAGKPLAGTPYGDELARMCSERSWCRHLGHLNASELKAWLGRVTLLALPSLEDNCPMVILEAMAAGVPTAASDIGGIPDLIENGITGILFDPRDKSSIQQGIKTLLRDANGRTRMSELAQQQARLRFLPKAVAAQHLEVYAEILSAR